MNADQPGERATQACLVGFVAGKIEPANLTSRTDKGYSRFDSRNCGTLDFFPGDFGQIEPTGL